MKILNVFEPSTTEIFLERIEKLTHETQPQWGKMNVAQMMAHVNVAYDIDNGKLENKPNAFARFMIKLFVKNLVIGDKPYKKSMRTAPVFLVTDERDFENEKSRLIQNIKETEQKGSAHYNGRHNPGFGPITAKEWNNLFSKHLDHHLTQFGV